jgi:UDP-N-acetylmuramoyl-tripeptide--D-alanyl-D-alanine ligase
MKPQSVAQLVEWTEGTLLQGDPTAMIPAVSTDSRSLPPGSLFVALAGEKFDAHNFLDQAAAAGASAYLVSRELPAYPAGEVILVDDTLLGLQRMAAAWRKAWGGKVLGITGSNGKTSTKDFVTAVLSQTFQVHATKGNLNNHIGLPLSVLGIAEQDEIAVLEMGMNHPGEIAPLAAIAQPNAAIISNVGTAHIEYMGSREAIAQEKGDLVAEVPEDGCVILNADDDFSAVLAVRTAAYVLTAGFSAEADVRVSNVSADLSGSQFDLQFPRLDPLPVRLPVPGRHMISNAALAAAAGYHFGLPAEEIIAGLESATLNKGRLQWRLAGGMTFLDDSYNANPDSMKAALQTLQDCACAGRRVVVLGRMGELGVHAESAHRELGEAVVAGKFPLLCTVGDSDAKLIGDGAQAALNGTSSTAVHAFPDAAACAKFLRTTVTPTDLILVKGSRSAAMEKVIEHFTD